MSGIQRDAQRQKALFLQATTGVRKYPALNDRVVLVYLRSIEYKFVARINIC